MFLEGHIEATQLQEIDDLQVAFGLNMTGEHRLRDLRIAYKIT